MKKSYILWMVLFVIAMASCSNEEIEVEKVASISYNVTTSSTYEPFGKSNFETQLLNKNTNYHVGVFTYLYNEEGERVDSAFEHTKTLGAIQQNFKVNAGKYTIVTIETIVNADYGYKSEFWRLVNTEKLSTCRVMLAQGDKTTAAWWSVIGISTNTVNVEKNTTINANPAPKGSLVNVNYYNFAKTNFSVIAFTTHNMPLGIMLDPALSGSDRYVLDDYNQGNKWELREFTLLQNNKKDGNFTLYLFEEGDVNWGLCPIVVNSEGKYEAFDIFPDTNTHQMIRDGQIYYAGICYTGKTCEAYMGNSSGDLQNWYKGLDIAETADVLYKTPNISWGASVSTVKSFMSFATLVDDIKATQQGDYYMAFSAYDYNHKTMLYAYYFQTSSNNLTESWVLVDNSYDFNDVKDQMTGSGFKYEGYSSEYDYYLFSSIATNSIAVVNMHYSNSANIIRYLPYPSSSNVMGMKMDVEEVIRMVSIRRNFPPAMKWLK